MSPQWIADLEIGEKRADRKSYPIWYLHTHCIRFRTKRGYLAMCQVWPPGDFVLILLWYLEYYTIGFYLKGFLAISVWGTQKLFSSRRPYIRMGYGMELKIRENKLSSVADKAARSIMKPVMYLFRRCQATECPEWTYPNKWSTTANNNISSNFLTGFRLSFSFVGESTISKRESARICFQ